MTPSTRTISPDSFVGSYGPAWTHGVLADHLHRFVEAGGRTRRTPSGRLVAITPSGAGWPVVCGELVWIDTEDGPIDGRCGARVEADSNACPGHAEERAAWRAMSEAEKAAWERKLDEQGF